ncbi:MAG: VWA domain-containing protein [Nitrospirae bacterium]|nr:VWA domain-containing protein [Nitrospirota bacterium]
MMKELTKATCLIFVVGCILPTVAYGGSLIFIIDRSGSMSPYAEEIKTIASHIIERYSSSEVILFNNEVETVTSKKDLLKKLKFGGGTDYGLVFKQVASNPHNSILFLTDGGANEPVEAKREGLMLRSKGVKQWCTIYVGEKGKIPSLLIKISDKVISTTSLTAGIEECLGELKPQESITDSYRNIDIENLKKQIIY